MLPRDVLLGKVEETVGLGGDQIMMQGGLHPHLRLAWYEELLADLRRSFPQVNIHAFSPPELHHLAKLEKLPVRAVLQRLKAAGLGSIPGGGAEILADRVRQRISRGKVSDRPVAQRDAGLARVGRVQYGDDDVRTCGDVRRAS